MSLEDATPSLRFDFDADIRKEYARRLASLGVPAAPHETVDTLIVRFFSLLHRRIDPAERDVIWSVEFQAQAPHLSGAYREAIATIEALSRSGDDLNPYQSRDLAKKPWKPDSQSLDWGVTHLHLGLVPSPHLPGMIAGTPDLLFVVVRPDTLYLIGVFPHEFADQSVFDIAVKNWPHLFEHAALHEVVRLEHNPNAMERKRLREGHVHAPTMAANGIAYGAVGGGVTTSGAPAHIVRAHLLPRTGPMAAWQRLCENKPAKILAMIPEAARDGLTTIEIHASETSEGAIAFTATNLVGGPVVLGTGHPPKS